MTQSTVAGLGCGTWTAYGVGRGGSPVRLEIPYTGLSVGLSMNDSGRASLALPALGPAGSVCCEVFDALEPWRDEVALYRDDDVGFAGPITQMSADGASGNISASDLFAWMDQRWLETDFHFDGDVADIFAAIFELAYSTDTSPNIDLHTRHAGVHAIRDVRGVEFQRAADLLRELARTSLDFTTDGRSILAGDLGALVSEVPLVLHDEGVSDVRVTRDGTNFATDVALFGGTITVGGTPVIGRSTGAVERYGLVQRSYTELTVRDKVSADAGAEARRKALLPVPWRVQATLSPNAAFGWSDLVCGRLVDLRVSPAVCCVEVSGVMRISQVSVDASTDSESITIDLVPLGDTDG